MKSKKTIYYKVVKRVDGTDLYVSALSSVWVNAKELQWTVTYKLNDWAYPVVRGSKLFVFKCELAARDFAKTIRTNLCMTEHLHVFRCEVERPSKPKFIADIGSPKRIVNFWNSRKGGKRQLLRIANITQALPTTIFCDSVKLIEEIV